MNVFEFEDIDPPSMQHLTARITSCVRSKEGILAIMANAFHFPGYFGYNWDALSDCLRDFHWAPDCTASVIHDVFPFGLDDGECMIYLSILHDAVLDWRKSGVNRLTVNFPKSAEGEVMELLAKYKDARNQ